MSAPTSPVGQLLRDILADGQWHDYKSLVEWVVASGMMGNQVQYRRQRGVTKQIPVRELVQRAVKSLTKQNAYETQVQQNGKRHYITAVRKRPHFVAGQTLKSCSRCGAHGLDATQRVRRVLEYRIPTMRTRKVGSTGLGDVIAAKFKTLYLCIPCAEEELKIAESAWRIKPPFDYSTGEVRRDASTINNAGYLRKWGTRSRRKQRRGEHLPEEESRKSG